MHSIEESILADWQYGKRNERGFSCLDDSQNKKKVIAFPLREENLFSETFCSHIFS